MIHWLRTDATGWQGAVQFVIWYALFGVAIVAISLGAGAFFWLIGALIRG